MSPPRIVRASLGLTVESPRRKRSSCLGIVRQRQEITGRHWSALRPSRSAPEGSVDAPPSADAHDQVLVTVMRRGPRSPSQRAPAGLRPSGRSRTRRSGHQALENRCSAKSKLKLTTSSAAGRISRSASGCGATSTQRAWLFPPTSVQTGEETLPDQRLPQ